MHYELHSLQLCRQKSPYERYDTPEDLYYHKRERCIARQFEIRSMINCWCETLPGSPAGAGRYPPSCLLLPFGVTTSSWACSMEIFEISLDLSADAPEKGFLKTFKKLWFWIDMIIGATDPTKGCVKNLVTWVNFVNHLLVVQIQIILKHLRVLPNWSCVNQMTNLRLNDLNRKFPIYIFLSADRCLPVCTIDLMGSWDCGAYQGT